ncbi:hypothetical protein BgiMline_028449 [Biomphalaria glabrata]|nr:hypothetical protein BgiMline_014246 [Biomphalaria glabrata]
MPPLLSSNGTTLDQYFWKEYPPQTKFSKSALLALCLDSAWTLPGLCPDSAWTLPGLCPDSAWTLPGLCLDTAWTLPGLCLDSARTLPLLLFNIHNDMFDRFRVIVAAGCLPLI